jgi:hypothetical protein
VENQFIKIPKNPQIQAGFNEFFSQLDTKQPGDCLFLKFIYLCIAKSKKNKNGLHN